jgi:hypothetical protein
VAFLVMVGVPALACAGSTTRAGTFGTTSGTVEPSRTSEPSPRAPTSRNLDRPPFPAIDAEVDMPAGRLNKLPVSWFYMTRIAQPSGSHRLRVRTRGCAGAADTALLVTYDDGTSRFAAFDNDGNTGEGNGRCSLVDLGEKTAAATYAVYVFSMTRATSHAAVEISKSAGEPSWAALTEDDFGGTLVRVGALRRGEFVKVETENDGTGNDPTRLVLFEPPPAGSTIVGRAAIFNDIQSTSDLDPAITVNEDWPSRSNAALVGKDARSTASLAGIETRVDLVRGPLDADETAVPLQCGGTGCTGSTAVLPRGRYYVTVFARTSRPFAGLAAGEQHLASEMGTDQDGACPSIARGIGNGRAFTAILKKNGAAVATRVVPRALLGDDQNLGSFNRIVFEAEGDGTSTFAVDVADKKDDVTFFASWRYVRNADVNELKVTSWNFAHWAEEDSQAIRTAIVQNAADVLGTRGTIVPAARRVDEPANQAPWQWEADVMSFQEFKQTTHQPLLERLRARTSYGWSVVNANTEITDVPGYDAVFYGPVLVDDAFRPAEGIKYGPAQLDDGVSSYRCNSNWDGPPSDYACPLGYIDNATYDFYNRAIPVKLRAKRGLGRDAGTDRPVAFFNWHLYYETPNFSQRRENVENMVKAIKYLMARPSSGRFPLGACAFNKECKNDPRHYANRIIIVGDSNMHNHRCGEFMWNIRRLREEFGYAVDVSSATLDASNRTFDMQFSGAPLTDPNAEQFVHCEANGASKTAEGPAGTAGCPYHYQGLYNWNLNTAAGLNLASWYPWWAATSQNEHAHDNGGERYDVVFLVGRGWAYDDPILSYRVLSHRDDPSPMASPMNGYLGGGIEAAYDVNDCVGNVADGHGNYAPNFQLRSCGVGEGSPAIRSDHVPIGARLRIWAR